METVEYSSFPFKVTRTELDGGPTIITGERDSAKVDVRIVNGSGASSDPLSGLTHIQEHLLLRDDAHPELRAVMLDGCDINGETEQTITSYTAEGPSAKAAAMCAALCVCCGKPRFERAFIDSEREIVLNELRENIWDVQEETWRRGLMYPHDHSMHRSEFGKLSDIRRIRARDLRAHYEAHYVRRNLLVIAIGGVSHQQIVETVQASPLMALPSGQRRRQRPVQFASASGVFSKYWNSSPAVYVYLPIPAREAERRLARMTSELLSIDSYGGIYKRLRLEEGKIYSPHHDDASYPECWTVVGAKASMRSLPSIEQALRDEVAKLVAGEISEDAWTRVTHKWRNFFDTVSDESNEFFSEYLSGRWQMNDLVDRWFRDALLAAEPKHAHALISKLWTPEHIARFRITR